MISLIQSESNNVEANQDLAGCLYILITNELGSRQPVKEHLSGSEEDFNGESDPYAIVAAVKECLDDEFIIGFSPRCSMKVGERGDGTICIFTEMVADGPAALSTVRERLHALIIAGADIGETFSVRSDLSALVVTVQVAAWDINLRFTAPFWILRCEGEDLRFVRDEEQTLCINISDLLTILKCKADRRFEGCGGRTLFYLKPDVKMTKDEGLGVYATPPEVRSIISRCNTLESERALATLRRTWSKVFGETWFR